MQHKTARHLPAVPHQLADVVTGSSRFKCPKPHGNSEGLGQTGTADVKLSIQCTFGVRDAGKILRPIGRKKILRIGVRSLMDKNDFDPSSLERCA